ncbi:MAG: helix-turn-helix domain-containing protein [Gammaproteobacteria bacterium]|nr:helix-turn-helix domain-containing protein [Gammaproteobacteria bacterium]
MSSAANAGGPEQGTGFRLRQAREAAGLAVSEVAAAMRVPARVVESLEAEDWSRLGAPVFVRGHLRSYARAVGLPPDAFQAEVELPPVAPPALKPRTFTPRYRLIAEQAARRMVYVVITATLAVPVWMVTRGHLDGTPAEVASLDIATGAGEAADAQAREQQRPFVASMTPLQSRQSRRQQAAPQAAASDDDEPALSLRFRQDSWVEISAHDGSLLEQALIRAGEERSYEAGQVGQVVLGNAGAVQVSRFGDIQDIGRFQRANVARFTVSSDGSLAPAGD